MTSQFNVESYMGNLDTFGRYDNNNYFKNSLNFENNKNNKANPIPTDLNYQNNINDVEVNNNLKTNGDSIEFTRVIKKSHQYSRRVKGVVTAGNYTQEPYWCKTVINPEKCPSQKTHFGGYGGVKYTTETYYQYDTYTFKYNATKTLENNFYYGTMTFSYETQNGENRFVGTKNYYSKIIKDESFNGSSNYSKEYYHKYAILFYEYPDISNLIESENRNMNLGSLIQSENITPIDIFPLMYQYKVQKLSLQSILGIIFILLLFFAIYIISRYFQLKKYGCKVNLYEMLVGPCGTTRYARY